MNNIGLYIKELRLQKGISQEELGKIVGVQRAAVQKWECGRTQNLKRVTIKKLADYFEVSPANFVDEDSEPINWNESNIKVITKYNKLNSTGQTKAESYIDGLLENPSYVKKEKNSTAHNSDDFVLDESILGTDYKLVANVGISEPPKVKKKGTHT